MDNSGWIKIHRKILENPLACSPNYLATWVVLLLLANHREKKMLWNGNMIVVKDGQFVTGRKKLASITGIPESTLERVLSLLESEGQIEQQKRSKYRLITIVNWKEYQTVDTRRTTDGQQTDTNNNNTNNIKNIGVEQSSPDIPLIIKEFETINPAVKKFYSNKTQRAACKGLIDSYGFEKVISVIKNTLPRTNKIAYFPSITTPLQLQDKWSTLEAMIMKSKNKLDADQAKSGPAIW